ncbi:hypothetical protein C0Q70_05885 [Pomacea canaliculata]|uniref:EamA domain-containing protein n=1 Tax=Pomacea canaliculata TaxID=400727 RepID=A0A2T7PMH0_POMCA|nr:hypothetical protein C0Q70_05885 [Pomacea canaliculata]
MEAKIVRAAFLVMIIGVVSDAQNGRHLIMTSEYTTYKGTSATSDYTTHKGTSVTSEENVTVSTTFPTNETDTTVIEKNVTLSTVSPGNVTYTTSHSSTTPKPQNNTYPEYVGFICAGIAVVFYGSNFIPVKKFDTGDGEFGWFGIEAEVPNRVNLNYIGVTLSVISSFIYMFVKSEVSAEDVEVVVKTGDEGETDPLTQNQRTGLYGTNSQEDILVFNKRRTPDSSKSINSDDQQILHDHSIFNQMSTFKKRVVGIALSVVSGLMYGLSFSPAISWQDNHLDDSQNSLDYVFSHYCGIFLTSSVYFFIYIAIKKNKPKVYPRVILPAIASGVMWGIATACWFIANKVLSEPVSFPIVTTIPGAIASLFWGVLIFHEIKGRKNIIILFVAFFVTLAGSVLAGFSHG